MPLEGARIYEYNPSGDELTCFSSILTFYTFLA